MIRFLQTHQKDKHLMTVIYENLHNQQLHFLREIQDQGMHLLRKIKTDKRYSDLQTYHTLLCCRIYNIRKTPSSEVNRI